VHSVREVYIHHELVLLWRTLPMALHDRPFPSLPIQRAS
jgi:hypothetical protein